MLISMTQACRALRGLRRTVRDRDLAEAVKALEDQLDYRYGSFFPLNSASRGNKDLIGILRQGTWGNRYRLHGRRLLEPGSLSGVDELDWSQSRPLLQIVLEVADLADTAYALRGRNGSIGWGMMSHGFSRTALAAIATGEAAGEFLAGQLEAAAADLKKLAEAALAQPEESAAVIGLRQEYYWLADQRAGDAEFGRLLMAPEHRLLNDVEAAALHMLMSDPHRPRRCSWQALAAAKLGVRPNTPCEFVRPPQARLHAVAPVPRQYRSRPDMRKLAAIA